MINISNKAIIDRFEENLVVLEYNGETYTLPKELFPKEAKEGDVVNIEISLNKNDTEKRKKEIQKLIDELFE